VSRVRIDEGEKVTYPLPKHNFVIVADSPSIIVGVVIDDNSGADVLVTVGAILITIAGQIHPA
jgi:hypothetical protein